MIEKNAVIVNKSGLHARPATEFVQLAKTFESKITIRRHGPTGDGVPVNAKSIVRLLAEGLTQGTQVVLSAQGPDETAAIDALSALIAGGFGEQ